jgi:hypothetical protein
MVCTVKDFWHLYASYRGTKCSNKKNSVRLRAGKVINTSYRELGVKIKRHKKIEIKSIDI